MGAKSVRQTTHKILSDFRPVSQQRPYTFNPWCSALLLFCYCFQDFDDVRRKLSGSGFQVVFDINGREAVEAEPILDALAGRGGSLEQYIYCSSAGWP